MEVLMKRLKLEDLEVESFETDEASLAGGTVHAHAATEEAECDGGSVWFVSWCRSCDPLDGTCLASCFARVTCPGYDTCFWADTTPCY
jgi:hypothetical protein